MVGRGRAAPQAMACADFHLSRARALASGARWRREYSQAQRRQQVKRGPRVGAGSKFQRGVKQGRRTKLLDDEGAPHAAGDVGEGGEAPAGGGAGRGVRVYTARAPLVLRSCRGRSLFVQGAQSLHEESACSTRVTGHFATGDGDRCAAIPSPSAKSPPTAALTPQSRTVMHTAFYLSNPTCPAGPGTGQSQAAARPGAPAAQSGCRRRVWKWGFVGKRAMG